jgi:hypothetical protein
MIGPDQTRKAIHERTAGRPYFLCDGFGEALSERLGEGRKEDSNA